MSKKNVNMLFVSQDPSWHAALEQLVQQVNGMDIQTKIAVNIEETVKLLDTATIDICLIDDDNNSKETLHLLTKLKQKFNKIPYIILTSNQHKDEISRAIDKSMDDCIVKDHLSPQLLEFAVHSTLKRNRFAKYATESINHNELTGLIKQPIFEKRLHQALNRVRRSQKHLALIYLDIDNFEEINEKYDYDTGDIILSTTAKRIKSSIRINDIASHITADAFAIMLDEINSAQDALTVANKIVQAMQAPFRIERFTIHVSISIGIAVFPSHGESSMSLLNAAFTAMSSAKMSGGNQCQYYITDTSDQAQSESTQESISLQFSDLHFQPRINLNTEDLVTLEATTLTAEENTNKITRVISNLESASLRFPYFYALLEKACLQYHNWNLSNVRLSIRLPNKIADELDLVSKIQMCLQHTTMDPFNLELRINESSLCESNDNACQTLRQLASIGVHIAIEHYGSQSSSIKALAECGVKTVIIDEQFTENVHLDHFNSQIVRGILALCNALNLNCVASGVRDDKETKHLTTLGCGFIQGKFVSDLLDLDEASVFINKNRFS